MADLWDQIIGRRRSMNLIPRVALVVVGRHRRLNPEARCTFQPAEHRSGHRCMTGFANHQVRKGISQKRDTLIRVSIKT